MTRTVGPSLETVNGQGKPKKIQKYKNENENENNRIIKLNKKGKPPLFSSTSLSTSSLLKNLSLFLVDEVNSVKKKDLIKINAFKFF